MSRTDSFAAWLNEGVAHHKAGRAAEAQAAFERVLALAPEHADALHFLGLLASARGDLAGAAQLMDRGLRRAPGSAMHWANRATLYGQQGDPTAAEACFRRAIALDPADAATQMNLARLLRGQRRADEERAALERVVELAPERAAAHIGLGRLAREDRRLDDAEAALAKAAAIAPDDPELLIEAVLLLLAQRRLDEAEARLAPALVLAPKDGTLRNLRALLLGAGHRHAEAEALLREILADAPGYHDARHNLALALTDQLRFEEAEAVIQGILAERPDHDDTRFHLGMMDLQRGRLATGWIGYDARRGGRLEVPFPEWRGEDLAGKRIALIGEQGLGDHLQLIRFVPRLAAMGATVDLVCDPALEAILGTVAGLEQITPELRTDVRYDHWCRIMSVAARLDVGLDDLPGTGFPYLGLEPKRVARWRDRIDGVAGARPRVALVWGGNPVHVRDHTRSLPLAALAPLADVPGIAWFSIQKGPPEAQLATVPAGWAIHALGPDLADLADTAAALQSLDLLITVDSSTAHLAGGLGRPAWVLLGHQPDWRWLLDRADSPWYPSARLFRQAAPGDWSDVAAAVAEALAAHPFPPR